MTICRHRKKAESPGHGATEPPGARGQAWGRLLLTALEGESLYSELFQYQLSAQLIWYQVLAILFCYLSLDDSTRLKSGIALYLDK